MRSYRTAPTGLPSVLLGLAAFAFLASCATIPEHPAIQWWGALPADSTLYVSMAVGPYAKAIKDTLKKAGPAFGDLTQIVDMTKRFFFGITLNPGEAVFFTVVGLGNYPAFFLGMKLGSSKDWKTMKSADGAWYEYKSGLQVSAPANSVFLISNGGLPDILPRLKAPEALGVPPQVVQDLAQSDLMLYMPELPTSLASKTEGNNVYVPIHEVWIDAHKSEVGFLVGGTVNLTTEKEAKLLAVLLKVALVSWMRSNHIANVAEKLSTVTVTPQGNTVVMAGLSLSEDEIVPILLNLILGGIAPQPDAGS